MHRRALPKLHHKERAIPPPQIKTGASWRGFGESCQLIYAGRPGGSPGPDIRDAILNFTSFRSGTECAFANNRLENTTGDVEIHIRASRHCTLPLSALRALLERLHTPTREPD